MVPIAEESEASRKRSLIYWSSGPSALAVFGPGVITLLERSLVKCVRGGNKKMDQDAVRLS